MQAIQTAYLVRMKFFEAVQQESIVSTTLMVHVSHLRIKIAEDAAAKEIVKRYGVGYKIEDK